MAAHQPKVSMLSIQPMLFDGRVQREAQSLRDAGYAVTIFYVEDPQFTESAPKTTIQSAWQNYHHVMQGITTKAIFLQARTWHWLPKLIRHLLMAVELFFRFTWIVTRHKAAIYHVHDLPPGIFGLWGKFLHGARLVYDAHELEIELHSREKTRFLVSAYEKLLITYSDVLLTVNTSAAEILQRRYGRAFVTLDNFPDHVPATAIDRDRLRQTVSLCPQNKVIMYVGYVSPHPFHGRGIEQLVEALTFLDEHIVLLLMAVGRLDEYKVYLRNYLDQLALDPARVQLIGPFPPQEIIHYLSGADISALLIQSRLNPSHHIASPNKLYQSIMARTPVIACNNATFPSLVYHNGVGPIGEVVDETNPEQIAQTLQAMLQPECQQLYRSNCEILAKRFSWQTEAEKLLHLYQRITL